MLESTPMRGSLIINFEYKKAFQQLVIATITDSQNSIFILSITTSNYCFPLLNCGLRRSSKMLFPFFKIIASGMLLLVSPASGISLPNRQPTDHSMGFIGCSMAENVAQGYVADGGKRMWGPYGTGALVVQSWTDSNSAAWQKFDQQAATFGKPSAVWVQICIFANPGATYAEVKQLIANARSHAASNATIYITGQPQYNPGQSCFLAGQGGAELTDRLAQQAGNDTTQNVTYPGSFILHQAEVQDGCHANIAGQASLGKQAIIFWG
ncbi:hypothetical protein F4678DRAFT_435529 [Xylaria arbuscula]|nr:hypothetical protein F4678DRAFT_435529 [Xylaria arbuscula]